MMRYKYFKVNYLNIESHNSKRKNEHDVKLGLNQFSALSNDEFAKLYLNGQSDINTILSMTEDPSYMTLLGNDETSLLNRKSVPKTFDWRDSAHGDVITAIKDQGQCGSCWAHSVTQSIESGWALAGNNLTELSVQQIVDCDENLWDKACQGKTNTCINPLAPLNSSSPFLSRGDYYWWLLLY